MYERASLHSPVLQYLQNTKVSPKKGQKTPKLSYFWGRMVRFFEIEGQKGLFFEIAGVVGEDFLAQAGGVDVEVDFGGGYGFMAEHLLDCAEVGAAFE